MPSLKQSFLHVQVVLAIAASDNGGSGIADLCITNALPCSSFRSFVTPVTWNLTRGDDGLRTVYVTLRDAAGNVAAPYQASVQLNAPCKLLLNGGESIAQSSTITATLMSPAACSGAQQMCVTARAGAKRCSQWASTLGVKRLALGGRQGLHTVTAFFADSAQQGLPYNATASITLDSKAPIMSKVTMSFKAAYEASSNTVRLTWGPAQDAGSKVAGYKLVYLSKWGKPQPKCLTSNGEREVGQAGQLLSGSPAVLRAQLFASYQFRLCAVDAAGNVATGLTASIIAQ